MSKELTLKEQFEEYKSPVDWFRNNIDDDSEYWEPLELIGSYSLYFIHQLLKERNKVIQDIRVGFMDEKGDFDEEATEHFYNSFWKSQRVQEQIELAFRISGWEGRAGLTFTPSSLKEMPLVLNVPTSIPRIEFFGQKLMWMESIQTFQKGTMVDNKQQEYALKQKFSSGKINQDFTREIDNKISITGETFSKNVGKILANKYPASVKNKIDLGVDDIPAIYFEDYPMLNKLGLPMYYELNPMLIQLDLLHIERYLYLRYSGNKIKVDNFDGDIDEAKAFAGEVREQLRTNYITYFGDYDNFNGEWDWEGADYKQLAEIDDAIERQEKKIANIFGIEWLYSKSGTYNSTKGETDRLANQQNVIGQNKRWVNQIKEIAHQIVGKWILFSKDEKIQGRKFNIFLRETDYSLREFIKDKGLDFQKQGIISGAEIREILFGEAPWIAKQRIEDNQEEAKKVNELVSPPKQEQGGKEVDNAKDK